MKQKIKQIIAAAVKAAHEAGALPSCEIPPIEVEEPKLEVHGDFSTNIAMVSAGVQKMAPRQIAEVICKYLPIEPNMTERTEIAGPGFINFFIHPAFWHPILTTIHLQDQHFGSSDLGKGKRVQVEYVSSNPTGPLHVGHGRGAVVGDSVANLFSFCGFDVQREYYINDSGRQILNLGRSVYLRGRELMGETIVFPDECYKGRYIVELAKALMDSQGDSVFRQNEETGIASCARYAADHIIVGIRNDLDSFGVTFDRWFSEQSLYDEGKVAAALEELKQRQTVYESDGALWFKTSSFGDEKDRVVVRRNGQTTYFASDIAYHQDKYARGFEWVIDVWGADHHGYIPRMKAAVEASGYQQSQFHVILVKLVNLFRSGAPVAMSTRGGEFVTLKSVVEEVGKDAARFLFLTRHHESTLDFDLEAAKKKSNENPVYYVQYVHARISSILQKGRERGIKKVIRDDAAISRVLAPEEIQLMKAMSRYPETISASAESMEPHRLTFYLMDLASRFHTYYNKHRVLTDDPILTKGRLYLVSAVQKVIRNGLTLLGVSAPEKM